MKGFPDLTGSILRRFIVMKKLVILLVINLASICANATESSIPDGLRNLETETCVPEDVFSPFKALEYFTVINQGEAMALITKFQEEPEDPPLRLSYDSFSG